MQVFTNEEILELIPSESLQNYLKKINWQFSEKDKDILFRYLKQKEEPSFYDDYVPIPYPFRSGDLVKEIGKNEIGVISRYKDDEFFYKEFEHLNNYGCLDWSDTGITRIDFLGKDGKFYHTHISAIYLEAVEIHTDIAKDTAEAYYRTAILIASNFIRGTENSIEELQMCCNIYTKLIKKNK